MAADAKLQYAATGGNMTFGIAAKIVGATAMAAISVATAGNLMKACRADGSNEEISYEWLKSRLFCEIY